MKGSGKVTFTYHGNPFLKAANVVSQLTQENLIELAKCKADPIYFIENYVKIRNINSSDYIPFKLYDFQKKMIKVFHDNRFSIVLSSRQAGKSSVTIAYFLWCILFNSNYEIALCAQAEPTTIELLGRLQEAYYRIPFWMQQGIVRGGWNKKSIHLENGSKIFAFATSSNALRGRSFNCVTLDSTVTIQDEDGNIKNVTIEELKKLM